MIARARWMLFLFVAALAVTPTVGAHTLRRSASPMTLEQRLHYQREVIRHDTDVLRWFQHHPLRTVALARPTVRLRVLRDRQRVAHYHYLQRRWTRRELLETKSALALKRQREAAAREQASLDAALYSKWNYLVSNCEAPGSGWYANTGNGFFFGPQFVASTWHSNGGGPVAEMGDSGGLPMRSYSIGYIIGIAENTLRSSGPGAWPWCHAHGYI